MSRCFPFPPPGYARNWANGQNLVDSTKHEKDIAGLRKALRKENEKKDVRKEKERRKARKEKKEKKLKDAFHKTIDGYGSIGDKLGQQYNPSKEIVDVPEQVEKSVLTEEHEQPQNLFCYLSDGTQGNKRKREEPPAVESRSQVKPRRICVVFKKSKEPEAVPDDCSTSGAELPIPIEKVAQDTRTSVVAITSLLEKEQRLPLSSHENDGSIIPIDTKKKKHKRSMESQCEALFEAWVPPVILSVLDNYADDDHHQEWLFGTKKQERPVAKRAKVDEDTSMSLSCGASSRLKAQFLPDLGIHSLPYTSPF